MSLFRAFLGAFLSLIIASSCASYAKPFAFMPENDLYKEDRLNELSQVTEAEFIEVIDQVFKFYKPIVEGHGAELKFVKKWKDPTVNAYAHQSGNAWYVTLFGGLARRKEVTKDAFQMVVCHEMGHHLGGFPFVEEGEWAANDGQADYFSTLSCVRELWKSQSEKNKEAAKSIEPFPKKLCDASWKTKEDKFLCYRVLQAGKSLSDLLSSGTAKFQTPSKIVVTKTLSTHPPGQCRLDTYVAGSVCHKGFSVHNIPQTQGESEPFTCFDSKKEKGARPKCWFKEEE